MSSIARFNSALKRDVIVDSSAILSIMHGYKNFYETIINYITSYYSTHSFKVIIVY